MEHLPAHRIRAFAQRLNQITARIKQFPYHFIAFVNFFDPDSLQQNEIAD
jgi:hypothetical protein